MAEEVLAGRAGRRPGRYEESESSEELESESDPRETSVSEKEDISTETESAMRERSK